MSNGTQIEVEEVVSVAESTRRAAETMGEAASYAAEADPDLYMWGAVGMPLAQVYFAATPHIHQMLQRVPAALAGVAGRIEAAAGEAEACDQEAGRAIDKLQDLIDGLA